MNDNDFDLAARAWLDDGPTRMSDHALVSTLEEIHTTRQRRVGWPAWRTYRMNIYVKLTATAAAVLVVAITGYQFLPLGSGSGGTSATPTPSPELRARGVFVTDSEAVDLEATGEGSNATGRMTVSDEGYSFTVDLQCTRTTVDGLIMIGGVTTDTAGDGSVLAPVGSRAAIALGRGSPVRATIWSQRGGPTSQATSCLVFLDERLLVERKTHPGGDFISPIVDGFVELGP